MAAVESKSIEEMVAEVKKNSGWYSRDPPEISTRTRDVLERYSKIPSDEVDAHVRNVRDRAFAVRPYPCIGRWRFLELSLGQHPLYQEILSRMRTGQQTLLDLGCAFAQDIRRLVADGVDSSKCYGSDLQLDFLELGYDLFRDRETLQTRFIAADIFDPNNPLNELEGQLDIISASSFFHLFTLSEQKTVALRVAKLLKPQPDSIVLGRQVGRDIAGEEMSRSGQRMIYRHNPESWENMWSEVGSEMGVKFEVNSNLVPRPGDSSEEPGLFMQFSVRRK